jgi:hypothetical protein
MPGGGPQAVSGNTGLDAASLGTRARVRRGKRRRNFVAFLLEIGYVDDRQGNGAEDSIVIRFLTASFLCLALSPVHFARAGDASSQNSLFLPSGKSEVEQVLEAKKNARCVALYGPGYSAIANTDTCIRIGGRVGVTIGGSSKQNRLIVPSQGIGAPPPTLGGPAVTVVRQPKTGSATSADVYVDTRTQTEIGEIGTHVSVGAVRATGAFVGPDYVH